MLDLDLSYHFLDIDKKFEKNLDLTFVTLLGVRERVHFRFHLSFYETFLITLMRGIWQLMKSRPMLRESQQSDFDNFILVTFFLNLYRFVPGCC